MNVRIEVEFIHHYLGIAEAFINRIYGRSLRPYLLL